MPILDGRACSCILVFLVAISFSTAWPLISSLRLLLPSGSGAELEDKICGARQLNESGSVLRSQGPSFKSSTAYIVSNYSAIGTFPTVSMTSGFTISFFFSSNGNRTSGILGLKLADGDVSILKKNSNVLQVQVVRDSMASIIKSDVAFDNKHWTFISTMYNSSSDVLDVFYDRGAFVGNLYTTFGAQTTRNGSTVDITLGGADVWEVDRKGGSFNIGKYTMVPKQDSVSCFSVYDIPLSPSEIREIYMACLKSEFPSAKNISCESYRMTSAAAFRRLTLLPLLPTFLACYLVVRQFLSVSS